MPAEGEAACWWTNSGLCFVSSDVGFATVQLMTGFHPGITERPDRLRTYCTRRVRRDHPCNNAPSLPKNDQLTGGLGAGVRCQEPPLLKTGLKVIVPIRQHGRGNIYPAGNVVLSECREVLSGLQQGGGHGVFLRRCHSKPWGQGHPQAPHGLRTNVHQGSHLLLRGTCGYICAKE